MSIDPKTIDDLVARIDKDRLVQNLADLVSIPSVNPFNDPPSAACRELEFGRAYGDYLADAGMDVFSRDVVPGRPNVFGKMGNPEMGPCIMLAGHLDTVGIEGYTDPFNPKLEDGRLHGRGSCDMKAALAAYIEVAKVISEAGVRLNGELLVAGVADEEHMMIGSKEVSANGPLPDFAIVGEPTDLKICHSHKGQLCLPLRTFGRAVHSSVPELGINAISHMASVVHAIEKYGNELLSRDPDPVCGHARVNAGVIRGGSISSSVPDFCELEVDRRMLAGETLETVVAEYRSLLEKLGKEVPDFEFEIGDPTLNNAALDTPEDSPIVTAVSQAYRDSVGSDGDIGAFPAATDAPNYHCPAVICGPGSVEQAHTLNEYVEIQQVVSSAKIYLRAVLDILT